MTTSLKEARILGSEPALLSGLPCVQWVPVDPQLSGKDVAQALTFRCLESS